MWRLICLKYLDILILKEFFPPESDIAILSRQGLLSAIDVNDVYIGNGVSELIVMTMQALLDDDDEILIRCLIIIACGRQRQFSRR